MGEAEEGRDHLDTCLETQLEFLSKVSQKSGNRRSPLTLSKCSLVLLEATSFRRGNWTGKYADSHPAGSSCSAPVSLAPLTHDTPSPQVSQPCSHLRACELPVFSSDAILPVPMNQKRGQLTLDLEDAVTGH